MKSQTVTTLLILLVSTAAAVGANLVRERPLPWIRQPVLVPVQINVNKDMKSPMIAATPANPVAAGNSATSQPMGSKPGVVAMPEVLKYLRGGGAFFIDAREEHELKDGMLRGAIHLPSSAIYPNMDRIMSTIPPDAKVIVYCGGGECEASHNVREALIGSFNFTDVWVYEKGWAEVSGTPAFREFVVAGSKP